jgi:hypothetical protein
LLNSPELPPGRPWGPPPRGFRAPATARGSTPKGPLQDRPQARATTGARATITRRATRPPPERGPPPRSTAVTRPGPPPGPGPRAESPPGGPLQGLPQARATTGARATIRARITGPPPPAPGPGPPPRRSGLPPPRPGPPPGSEAAIRASTQRARFRAGTRPGPPSRGGPQGRSHPGHHPPRGPFPLPPPVRRARGRCCVGRMRGHDETEDV